MTEREQSLWDAYHADRSITNRNKLVEHYYRLAISTTRYCIGRTGKGQDLNLRDEVQSVVSESLIRSIGYYDPSRGAAPKSWLIFCMRQVAWKALRIPDPDRSSVPMGDHDELVAAKPKTDWSAYHKIFGRLCWDLTIHEEKILVMSYEFGMGPLAISRELGKPIRNEDIDAIFSRLAKLHTIESLQAIA